MGHQSIRLRTAALETCVSFFSSKDLVSPDRSKHGRTRTTTPRLRRCDPKRKIWKAAPPPPLLQSSTSSHRLLLLLLLDGQRSAALGNRFYSAIFPQSAFSSLSSGRTVTHWPLGQFAQHFAHFQCTHNHSRESPLSATSGHPEQRYTAQKSAETLAHRKTIDAVLEG